MANALFRKKVIGKDHQGFRSHLSDGHGGHEMKKVLGVRDLTFMGVAAVIGAGIFSTIGTAAYYPWRSGCDLFSS